MSPQVWRVVELRATIRTLSTAYLLWQAGLAPEGESYWSAGEAPLESLLASGAVRRP